MSIATQYNALQHALHERGAVQEPAEVHGTLCGMLCVNENTNPSEALEDADELGLAAPLAALREVVLEALFDSQAGFMPMLPSDDNTPLEARVKALARWCSGFVYGLACQPEFDMKGLSEEVQEVIRDLTEFWNCGLHARKRASASACIKT